MNLRLADGQIRLRLARGEFEKLRAGKAVSVQLHFGAAQQLTLVARSRTTAGLDFADNRLEITLDPATLDSLVASAARKEGVRLPLGFDQPDVCVQIDLWDRESRRR